MRFVLEHNLNYLNRFIIPNKKKCLLRPVIDCQVSKLMIAKAITICYSDA
jgi:hypothetical protein